MEHSIILNIIHALIALIRLRLTLINMVIVHIPKICEDCNKEYSGDDCPYCLEEDSIDAEDIDTHQDEEITEPVFEEVKKEEIQDGIPEKEELIKSKEIVAGWDDNMLPKSREICNKIVKVSEQTINRIKELRQPLEPLGDCIRRLAEYYKKHEKTN